MLFKSLYSPNEIPYEDIYTFIFEQPRVPRDQVVIIDAETDKTITFGEIQEKSLAFAGNLTNLFHFKAGDRLALFSPNHILYSTVLFGTIVTGGAVTTANPNYTAAELARQIAQTEPKVMVTSNVLLPAAKEALKLARIEKTCSLVVFEDVAGPGVYPINQLFKNTPFQRPKVNPDSTAYICYSSGTSGHPKGVETTHRNIISSVCQQIQFMEPEEHTLSGVLPFYHMYGLCCCLHSPLTQKGSKIVILSRFDMEKFLYAIEKYKISKLVIVPPIALGLLKHPLVAKFDLSSIKKMNSGAAPLGKELTEGLVRKYKIVIVEGYGLTETSPTGFSFPHGSVHYGSVGQLMPGMEAKVVDPNTGKVLGYNEEGEIWLRGPNIMRGYYNNPKATADSIDKDGFFHTGDVGKVDTNGFWYITDRLKELIKYKGFQVAPAELEAKLVDHKDVADAAVIGVQDPEHATEIPKAFVVLQMNVEPSEKLKSEIIDFVNSQVAPHKKIRGGIEFTNIIPKSPAGKIQRRLLKEAQEAKDLRVKAKL